MSLPKDHISYLDNTTKTLIYANLNQNDPLGRDWRYLSQLLNFKPHERYIFENSKNPAKEILEKWGSSSTDSNVTRLRDVLKNMQREDLAVLLPKPSAVTMQDVLKNTQREDPAGLLSKSSAVTHSLSSNPPSSQPAAYLNRSRIPADHISNLPVEKFVLLCACLNAHHPLGNDWENLLRRFRYHPLSLANFRASPNPTESLLQNWGSDSVDNTISKLRTILVNMGRWDAVSILDEYSNRRESSNNQSQNLQSNQLPSQSQSSTRSKSVFYEEPKLQQQQQGQQQQAQGPKFPAVWTRTPVQLKDNETGCEFCMSVKCEVSLQPCGHPMCMQCAHTYVKDSECPTCHQHVTDVVGVFFP